MAEGLPAKLQPDRRVHEIRRAGDANGVGHKGKAFEWGRIPGVVLLESGMPESWLLFLCRDCEFELTPG
jgi:hypothetical protein